MSLLHVAVEDRDVERFLEARSTQLHNHDPFNELDDAHATTSGGLLQEVLQHEVDFLGM